MFFQQYMVVAQLFHASPDRVKALRVHRMLPVPPTIQSTTARDRLTSDLARKLEDDAWVAAKAMSPAAAAPEVKQLVDMYKKAENAKLDPAKASLAALMSVAELAAKAKDGKEQDAQEEAAEGGSASGGGGARRGGRVNLDEDMAQDDMRGNARAPKKGRVNIPDDDEDEDEHQNDGMAAFSGDEEYDPGNAAGNAFDYTPRATSRLRKMGVGLEDIAAIKPQDIAAKSEDGAGALAELSPEVLAALQKGAKTISANLFSGTQDGE